MNAIAEIDKAGRIVVPKKMRDVLHPVAGTRLTLKQHGDCLTLEPEKKPGELVLQGAILVRHVDRLPQLEHRNWVGEDREARMQVVAGDWIKL